MKVPNLENALVPDEKITGYLLSETHADGKHKARFFRAFGFSLDDWRTLERAVRQHPSDHEVADIQSTPFGIRYVVEGIMETPDGRSPRTRTVWFIRKREEIPHFVTAYPLRRDGDD